jgi:SAM-dependent methyltransferase
VLAAYSEPVGWTARLLEHPLAYRLTQAMFSEAKFAPVRRHNDLRMISRVLDVGCGPGTNTARFTDCGYLGVDINERYVDDARRRHGRDFVAADATEFAASTDQRFDFILVNSFLHHLPADEARAVVSSLNNLLTADGHVHILELVLPERWSLAFMLARWDRGDHARPVTTWRELFEGTFTAQVVEPYRVGVAGVTLWNMVYFKGSATR